MAGRSASGESQAAILAAIKVEVLRLREDFKKFDDDAERRTNATFELVRTVDKINERTVHFGDSLKLAHDRITAQESRISEIAKAQAEAKLADSERIGMFKGSKVTLSIVAKWLLSGGVLTVVSSICLAAWRSVNLYFDKLAGGGSP